MATFYKEICKIYCACAVNLQTHFLGSKHKALEDALKAHGIVKPLNPSGGPVTLKPLNPSADLVRESIPDIVVTAPEQCIASSLEEQLNSCKDAEPALGLQYITEYRSTDSLIYECNLCISKGGLTSMFMHVLGIKHRMAYLKKHHPDLAHVKGRGSKLKLRLKEVAAQVEEEEGRQQIKLYNCDTASYNTEDLPILKEDIFSVDPSDSLITWFLEDDDSKGKKKEFPKSMAKVTDKKAEESSKAEGEENNKSEDKTKPESILFVDIDSDSEEFTSNEELLEYLRSFKIIDEDDAAFILKVTQKFTDALILYREKASERKNSQEQNPGALQNLEPNPGTLQNLEKNLGALQNQEQNPGALQILEQNPAAPQNQKQNPGALQNQEQKSDAHSEQKTSVGASKPRPEDDFSEWELPVEQSFEHMETNSSVKIPTKRKASELHTDLSKDKVKTCKRDFAAKFKGAPNDRGTKGPAGPQGPRTTFRDARRLGAGRGRGAASRDLRRPQAAKTRERQLALPSRLNKTRVPPSVTKRNVTRKRKKDDVLDTSKFSLPFSAYVGPRKTVWIVGHNIVYFAEDYAASSGWGTGLGLEDRVQITWMGKRGMQWDDLLPAVSLQAIRMGSPDALIIHLGENDLAGPKGSELYITISADLHALRSRLPNTWIFWSDLLERRDWPGSTTPEKVDLVRREVSTAAGRLIEATGGSVIQHLDITFKHKPLYKADGIHLSEWGQDIWLHSIRHALLCWVSS